jgi:DNA integrity scanning protein DisA with diadenylate cyclase activity
MESKQPLGLLFETMAYYSEESVEQIIDNLELNNSLFILSQALEMAHSKNIFSLTESEIISKCLRILNKEIYSYDDRTGQDTTNVENNRTGE